MRSFILKPHIIIFILGLMLSSCFEKESAPGQNDQSSKQPILPINHPPITNTPTTDISNLSTAGEILGSRFYIRSFLKEIFYNATSASALELILDKYLGAETEDGTSNQASFINMHLYGGPCDYYSEAGSNKGCNFLPSNLLIPLNAPTTASRESERMKICVEVTNNDTILAAGLNKIGLTTSSLTNSGNIQLVFELFYPGYTLDSNTSNSFLNLISSMQSNSESLTNQWRMIFFTLCRSPDWQSL